MEVKDIDILLQDAVMEHPYPFRIEGRVFYVYPLTLGKVLLMQRLTEGWGLEKGEMKENGSVAILRIVKEKKEQCCALLSYLTARNDYYSVFDVVAFEDRKAVFLQQDDSDIAAFVVTALTSDRTGDFIKHLGLDREQKDMAKVMKVKQRNNKNCFTFGGVSIYGSLLDVAMERYKLTKRQVVWEIDYTSLRLLLADRVNTISVTEAERKKIKVAIDRNRISGDNIAAIKSVIQSQSWD